MKQEVAHFQLDFIITNSLTPQISLRVRATFGCTFESTSLIETSVTHSIIATPKQARLPSSTACLNAYHHLSGQCQSRAQIEGGALHNGKKSREGSEQPGERGRARAGPKAGMDGTISIRINVAAVPPKL